MWRLNDLKRLTKLLDDFEIGYIDNQFYDEKNRRIDTILFEGVEFRFIEGKFDDIW